MFKIRTGGEILQLVLEENEELVFDCAAHMKQDPHGREHQLQHQGIRVELQYSRVRATLCLHYPSTHPAPTFTGGSFVCVGGIWLQNEGS